jgi:hypothetical protein
LDTGKELERACDFAVALKFYFAGRIFFARLKYFKTKKSLSRNIENFEGLERKWKTLDTENEFKIMYEHLLPMTNAEVDIALTTLHNFSLLI